MKCQYICSIIVRHFTYFSYFYMLYHLTLLQTIYLFFYIFLILYSAMLGFWLFTYRDSQVRTHGEIVAKRRMTRAVGSLMFIWTFDLLIYLLPMLYGDDLYGMGNKMCFLVSLVLNPSIFYVVMSSIMQKWINVLRNACIIGMPFLLIGIWYFATEQTGMYPLYVAGCLNVVCIVSIMLKHISDYRSYIKRLRSEYSETTSRDILWAWWSFAGLAVQFSLFVAYQFFWDIAIEYIYTGVSIINAACLCYCTQKQRPMDSDIVKETDEDNLEMKAIAVEQEERNDDKAFYSVVEQRLEAVCKKEQLFLEPDLTRESLCQRLSIGRTYLSMYLRSRGLTFYQYINSLRLEYAIKLMQEHPEIPVREVCNLSGFRSQTTFRKVFQEVMGCLPSEMKYR